MATVVKIPQPSKGDGAAEETVAAHCAGADGENGRAVNGSSPGKAEDEPTATEQRRVILMGTTISAAMYSAVRVLVSANHAEDIVDMLHSFCTSSLAMYGVARMEPHPVLFRALPPGLAGGRGPMVRMFSCSLGYFFADVIKIAVDVLVRGKFPHLWAGRLVHHVVQLGANSPGIFAKGRSPIGTLAWRSVLTRAYVAELSSVFLRLSNLMRHGEYSPLARAVVNWSLVVSFFGSRIANFAIAIAMFIKARSALPPTLFKLGATVQTGGYVLSAIWFMKIVRIALNTKLTSPEAVPSLEC